MRATTAHEDGTVTVSHNPDVIGITLDQETGEFAAVLSSEAARRVKAERIARAAASEVWAEEEAKGTFGPEQAARYNAALRGARIAALAALTEKESAS